MAYDETSEPTALVQRPSADVIPFNPDPISLRDSTFEKIATKPVSKEAARILMAPAKDSEIEILPTGEVYVPQVHYRRRLNRAFRPMGWALRPLTLEKPDTTINQMYQRFALVAGGRVVATAVGSAKYYPMSRDGKHANSRMDYADVAESVKSNALTRCCKDIGVVSECWDRDWCEDWKDKHAVHVYVAEKQRDGKIEQVDRWRRIDAKPYPRELEPVPDSPNQDKWRKQIQAHIALVKAEHDASRKVAEELKSVRGQARTAAKEAQDAVQETRRASAGEPSRADVDGSQRRQEAPSAPVQHGGQPSPEDRPYLIRGCVIEKRGPGWILHKITMMDGQAWFTFSTTVYADMQKHYARRDAIEVTEWEAHKSGKDTLRKVTKWRVLRRGAQAE
jgi:hypothetical protein